MCHDRAKSNYDQCLKNGATIGFEKSPKATKQWNTLVTRDSAPRAPKVPTAAAEVVSRGPKKPLSEVVPVVEVKIVKPGQKKTSVFSPSKVKGEPKEK